MTRVLILVVLLLLFPIVVPPSEALPITGQLSAIDFIGFGFNVRLAGPSGFSLDALARSDFWPHCQVHGPSLDFLDHRCRSGEVVTLDPTWFTSSEDPGARATLRGASYAIDLTGEARTASAEGRFFTARATVPPKEVGATFKLQESFAFVGSFTYFDHDFAPQVEPLSGRGTLTFELFQSPRPSDPVGETLWELRDLSYNFAPTPIPEPATLLLVGTGAAGLGVARWWKRRRAARC
jgi:hypothetical protein